MDWRDSLRTITESVLRQRVIAPTFKEIGDKLTQSISDEFSGELRYRGGMEAGAIGNYKVVGDELEIYEPQEYGKWVRKPSPARYGKFPMPVVTWAMSKLGVDKQVAYKIAKSIQVRGAGQSERSLIRGKYRSGEPGFDYPEYVVDVKNKYDIVEVVEAMEGRLYEMVTA